MKCYIYCRKSTDTEDKQILSLDSQESELLSLATSLGLEVVGILKESRSAKEPGRPVYNAMLDDITKGKADGIICWKIDRLTRNPVDGGRLQWLLLQGNIKAIYTPGRTFYPTDNVMMLSIEQAMATQYLRDLSENVKRGNRAKLERGEWPNHAPFGYKNDKATKTIRIDRKVRPIIERIFELYSTGQYSIQGVADRLYAEGFRAPRGAKVAKSKIESILRNPFYFGLMERDEKYYPGNHKPIISRELFEKAKAVLEQSTRPKKQKHEFPLRGLLRCASCSCMYTATLKKGHEYYYCTNGKNICSAHKKYLRAEPATELVAQALEKVRFDDEIIEIMYEAARERHASQYSYLDAVRKRLQGQLEALDKREDQAFEDSASGLLRRELYERKMIDIRKQRTVILQELKGLSLKDQLLTLEPTKTAFDTAKTARNRFLEASPEARQRIASEILWNLRVKDGEIEEIQFKAPFDVMANAPKRGQLVELVAVWDDVGTGLTISL